MKISKREKILIVVLLLIIIFIAYYLFFMKKHISELNTLEETKQEEQGVKDSIELKLLQGSNLDRTIEDQLKQIDGLSKDKYSRILQENQIILVKRLSRDTGIKIKSMQFSESNATIDEMLLALNSIKEAQEKENTDKKANSEKKAEDTEAKEGEQKEENSNGENTGGEESAQAEKKEEEMIPGSAESLIESLSVVVKFEGNYEQVDAYLKNISNYERRIVVTDLSFNSGIDAVQNGTMTLNFYGIRDLEGIIKKKEENYFKNSYRRSEAKSAYLPYPGYVILNHSSSPSPSTNSSTSKGSASGTNDFKFNFPNANTSTQENQKSVRLDSFEKFDVFFVGSSSDVYGQVRLSSLSSDLANSLKVNYDFFNPAVKNRGNVIFDRNKKIIYEKISNVNLSVYADKSLGENRLGITIMDSTGDEKDFYFDNSYRKEKWEKLSTAIDGDLKYPIMLKGVFVEGDGIYQSVKGEFYIDNLTYVTE